MIDEVGTAVAAETASATSEVARDASETSSAEANNGGGNGQSGAALSDDRILGMGDGAAETQQAEGTDRGASGTAAASAAQTTGQTAELSIEQFKDLFHERPEVNRLWDRYSREHEILQAFGNATNAARAAEILQVIGGAERLEKMVVDLSDVEDNDRILSSGSPEERLQYFSGWCDSMGAPVIADNVWSALNALKSKAPQVYQELSDGWTREVLTQDRIPAFAQSLAQAYESGADLKPYVREMLQWMQSRAPAKGEQSPEERRLAAELEASRGRERGFAETQQHESAQRVIGGVNTTIGSEIDRMIGQAYPKESVQTLSYLHDQILAKAWQQADKNVVLGAELRALRARGASEQEVSRTLERALKPIVLRVAQQAINERSAQVIKQQKEQADRATAAAARPDAGTGAATRGRAPGSRSLTKDGLDKLGGYKKLSDDDILNL